MKIIVLGDTHGRSFWKYIVQSQTWDKVVFIGDYWDSFDIPFQEQRKNFREIIQFKKDNPENVKLLIGNHDFQYTRFGQLMNERYSGFQKFHCPQIMHEMHENQDLLQAAYLQDNYLFTHAGVTKTWLNHTAGLKYNDNLTLPVPVDEYINDVYKVSPKYFLFYEKDRSFCGESVMQSPIWVRPKSLMDDAFSNLKQVVGHTEGGKLIPEGIDDQFFFIDTLKYRQYLIIENGVTSEGNC